MTPSSILQLACPMCGTEIEVEYVLRGNCETDPVSIRTWCWCPISREQAYDLLMDYGARQAELATERAGERS